MHLKSDKVHLVHCCIDLELEQPKTNPQTPDSYLEKEEIIQVGYVIYTVEPDFKILKEFKKEVDIGVPLSTFIKQLTGITDNDISNGTTIENIYNELVQDQKTYNFSRVIKQWGSGDIECIKKEIRDEDWAFGRSGCNIKHLYQIYAEANGLNTSGGLSKCMNRCGLKWDSGRKHNALADASSTAKMHWFLFNKTKEGGL